MVVGYQVPCPVTFSARVMLLHFFRVPVATAVGLLWVTVSTAVVLLLLLLNLWLLLRLLVLLLLLLLLLL